MDSPIMYYALGVRTVIPMRMPGGVVADRSEGVHSPTSERRNLLETQYSRLTRTRTGGVELEPISRVDSRIDGGWVAEMGGCSAGRAHHLEKSASSFADTSIHRLTS